MSAVPFSFWYDWRYNKQRSLVGMGMTDKKVKKKKREKEPTTVIESSERDDRHSEKGGKKDEASFSDANGLPSYVRKTLKIRAVVRGDNRTI